MSTVVASLPVKAFATFLLSLSADSDSSLSSDLSSEDPDMSYILQHSNILPIMPSANYIER